MLLPARLIAIPLLLLFGQLSVALADGHDRAPVFVLPETGLATIAPRHLEFLEGFDHTASLDQLRNADWSPRLQADQSLVDGYWVRLRVRNSLPTSAIGIEHNYNTEKKIFAVHTGGIDEYAYWKQGVGNWMDEGRILGHYLVTMPPGEVTTIYSFFRSKPFDRYMSTVNGLDLSLIHISEPTRPY